MDLMALFLRALFYIMPAYIANASAVLFKGKTRIDMGCDFFDGKPVLGRNKTIEGFLGGVASGTIYAFLQYFVVPVVDPLTGFFLALGAMVGDSIGSFVKRRLDLRSGELAPFLDQWDFVLGAFLFVYLAGFFIPVALPTMTEALLILVMTVVIALLSNFVAYAIGLKEVPW